MKNYISETLIEGEQVVYEATLHWVVYVSWRSLFTLFIHPILARLSSEFAVTNKRVIWKQGIIGRMTGEMNLGKIENVQVDQSIAGRILDYGTVTLVGTGGTHESFQLISAPLRFRKAILQEQDDLGREGRTDA
ncbi:MAG: PH domain-containing protein [Candidatus Hydrogenedentes bacterium]|nr:PH domain-containing protein [Candidatus Hydrogenedentota bacterium]